MTPVGVGVARITRGFDPRELADLRLWLPHFLIPNVTPGTSLSTSDHWLGAPPIDGFPGSPADARWSADPADKAFVLSENTPTGAIWANPWKDGARGLVFDNAIRLNFVETGTATPYTLTLDGEVTLLLVLRNPQTTTFVLMDDGQATPEGAFGITSDRVQAVTSTRTPGSFGDIAPDDVEELNDEAAVVLLLLTRDSSNLWRCWVNGVEQTEEDPVEQDGTIVLKNLGRFTTDPGFGIEIADVLIYGADHTVSADKLNGYFAAQHGVPA